MLTLLKKISLKQYYSIYIAFTWEFIGQLLYFFNVAYIFSDRFIFLGSKITTDGDCSHEIKRHLLLGRKAMIPRQYIKKQRHHFANKCLSGQSYGFSSSHVWMWELDYKESWAPKRWCFWNVLLEKTLESPLDCKEIQPVHPKGNQFWISTGRTDAEAETPILWPPDVKHWLTWKDPDAGKDWRQEEKWMTEDERVEWHHQFDGHEFEQALGVGEDEVFVVRISCWALVRKSNVEEEIVEKGVSSLYTSPNLCKALHFTFIQLLCTCVHFLLNYDIFNLSCFCYMMGRVEEDTVHQGHLCLSWRCPCG